MRSRGRTFRGRKSFSRTSRDSTPSGPVSSRRHVPLARFRREVVGLLVAGHPSRAFDSGRALTLVLKWDRMVRLRHSQGKPPCNVADHILRYERDGAVCPCGAPASPHASASRDKERCRSCKRLAARSVSRDPESESRAYRQGARDGKEDARRGEASDIVAAWYAHKMIHHDLRAYAKGYIKGSKMNPRNREFEWRRVLRIIKMGPRRSSWGIMKTPGRDPSRSRR